MTKTKQITEQDDVESIIYAAVEKWYETHDAPAKDDEADEAINAILDVRGLRKLRGGEWSFDGTAEEFADAAKTGLDTRFADLR